MLYVQYANFCFLLLLLVNKDEYNHASHSDAVQDYETLPIAAATVMAHELGHNLGFKHDNELTNPCPCDDPGGLCIMNSYVRHVASARRLLLYII